MKKILCLAFVLGFLCLIRLPPPAQAANITTDSSGNATTIADNIVIDQQVLNNGTPNEHIWHPNCTPPAIEQFPKPFLSMQQRLQGGLIIHIIVAIYMFVSLAVLCEDYFVPALEVLTEALKIDPDVAGATFMAAASSVPAIAASIIAVLVAKGDLGVSTALGSAVLNAAGVVSVSALFAGKVVVLHRWPMCRDSFFFLISVIIMLLVLMDERVTLLESAIMCSGYIVYAVFMAFDTRMEKWFLQRITCLQDRVSDPAEIFPPQPQIEDTSEPIPTTIAALPFDGGYFNPGYKTEEKRLSISPYRKSIADLPPQTKVLMDGTRRRISLISLKRTSATPITVRSAPPERVNNTVINEQVLNSEAIRAALKGIAAATDEEQETYVSPLKVPERWFFRILWALDFPFTLVFYLTIPDCRIKARRKWFVVTFIMATFHITIASYILVWMISIIGFTLSISDTVMGFTFLAIGVTLPDIVASLLVVRKGFGDMAVCNALGSNIFEILVGLGVPWLIRTAFQQPGVPVVVESRGMLYTTICLFATVFFLVILTHINNWKMNRCYGAILMGWYITFAIFATLYESNVFGNFNSPTCPTLY